MEYDIQVLEQLANGSINSNECYDQLFPDEEIKIKRKAHFVKINIQSLEESKYVNAFLKIIFVLPLPIVIVNLFLPFFRKKIREKGFDYKDVKKLIRAAKGVKIDVESKDALVLLKIF